MINFIYLCCVILPLISIGCRGLDNIALNKTFVMMSVYPGYEGKESRAVDGNRNQSKEYCTHTDHGTDFTFVYVDLGNIANIYNITIYIRKNYVQRFHGYALYYSEKKDKEHWKLCYKDDPISDKPHAIVSHVCKSRARYVIIYQNHTSGNEKTHILEICEIEILGCDLKQFIKGGECVTCTGQFCADCDTDGICLECINKTYGDRCEKNCSESCVGGCNISTGQCKKCDSTQFGYFCNETCGQCLDKPNPDSCDDLNGTCVNGCKKGFTGQLCKEECNGTSFGYNCNQACSENCKLSPHSRQCNSSTGQCTMRCVAGKRGFRCTEECMSMTYGENCALGCGHCLNSSGCDSVSGECADGCDPGYEGFFCNETCSSKTFGGNCSEICGHCRNDTACDPFSGSCDSGCEPGYKGLTCTETCGLCRENTDCDQFNGTCLDGCQDGFQGEICNETCDNNYYGEDCNLTCIEHCAESSLMTSCHHLTGECLIGCKDGWIGKNCDTACSNGTFGQNCAWKCNERCAGESQKCDPRDGLCINGCIPGFGGSHCNMYCDKGSYGERCRNLCEKCFLKDCNHITGHCDHSEPLCEDGYRGEKCDTECEPCTFGNDCRHNCSDWCFEGICIWESKDIKNDTSRKDSKGLFKDFLPIFGGAMSAFVVVLTIITAYGAGKWCTGPKRRKHKRRSQCSTLAVEMSDDTFNMLDFSGSRRSHTTEIPVKCFQRIVAEKTSEDCSILRTEFSYLNAGIQRDQKNMADSDQKKRFSRFSRFSRHSMMSFSEDYYKVLLPSDTSNGEVLNANYIKNVEGKLAYIAAEVSHTIAVWEMVWMKNVSKIVIFSRGHDCKSDWAPNWPEVGETWTFQTYAVATKEKRDYACYSLYFLTLQKEKLNREIRLFHYNSWPKDDDVIPTDFVNFYFRVIHFPVTSSSINGPLLVQCSDGLGRTGVYIALDALYTRGLGNKKINVLQYVQTMRRCRQNMLQSFTQYVVLHRLLAEAFLNTYNPLPRKYYMLENEDNDAVSHMFSVIERNRPTYKLNDYSKAFRNMDLVSNINVLPLDRFYFSLGDELESDKPLFTNSITVPSYLSQDRFIISQLPLTFSIDNTIAVISKMPRRVIVLIGSREETEEVTQRLLDGISTHADEDTHKDLNKTSITETLCHTKILIQNKEKSIDHSLSICEMSSWPIKYRNIGAYTDMLKVLTIILETDPALPIILLSGDGASGCEVLCTVHNCLEQVFLDDEVDVSARIHQLQTRRPEFISTKEDLKLSLDVFRKCLCNIKKESLRVICDKMKKDLLN